MKLYRITLNIAVSHDMEFLAKGDFSVRDMESEIVSKAMTWLANASGIKELGGHVAFDSKYDEREV